MPGVRFTGGVHDLDRIVRAALPPEACATRAPHYGAGPRAPHTGSAGARVTAHSLRARGQGCRRVVCAAAAVMPAHAVVPQAPLVRPRPTTVVDPAYVEDPGNWSCQNAPHKLYTPR